METCRNHSVSCVWSVKDAFLSVLNVLILEPLLRKLEALQGIPLNLEWRRSVPTYADEEIVIESSHRHIDPIGETP